MKSLFQIQTSIAMTLITGLTSAQCVSALETPTITIEQLIDNKLKLLQVQDSREDNTLPTISQQLGFQSANELSSVKVGQGFPLYVIGLNKLKRYEKGADPWTLLSPTQTTLYPLSVLQDKELRTRSAATVTYLQEKDSPASPRVVGIGNQVLIRLLSEARDAQQKEGRCSQPSDCFVVSVPALSQHLFGYRDAGIKEFKVIALNQVLGHINKDDLRTAKEVLQQLSDEAKTGKYDKPNYPPDVKRKLDPNRHFTGEQTNATGN